MNKLEGPGSSIKFLRRKLVETEDGLVLIGPDARDYNSFERVVNAFEEAFNSAHLQKIPSDASIQLTDNSPRLNDNKHVSLNHWSA